MPLGQKTGVNAEFAHFVNEHDNVMTENIAERFPGQNPRRSRLTDSPAFSEARRPEIPQPGGYTVALRVTIPAQRTNTMSKTKVTLRKLSWVTQ